MRVRGRGRKMSTVLGPNPHKYMIKMSIFDIQTLCESVLKFQEEDLVAALSQRRVKEVKLSACGVLGADTMASLNKPPFFMWRGPLFKLLPPTRLPLDMEGGREKLLLLKMQQKKRIKQQAITYLEHYSLLRMKSNKLTFRHDTLLRTQPWHLTRSPCGRQPNKNA